MMNTASLHIHNIPGGIHLADNKQQSVQEPVQQAPVPRQLVFPLLQGAGAAAVPVVAVGDKVLKGQMLAQATDPDNVPVHASTSGHVVAIAEHLVPHASGMAAPCIIIDSDGKDEWITHEGISDYRQVDKHTLLERIHQAGIAGMGGAGFPTAAKLAIRPEQQIDTLIINAAECEPYITSDDMLMRERAEQVIGGIQILQHLLQPAQHTVIGIEDNKPEAIAALQKAAAGSNIHIAIFPTKYPSGGEKQLIQILTGKQVPSGKLPADIGIVCQNIATSVAIYRAIIHGEPLISRITTVTGDAVAQPRNYDVLLGTPIRSLLDASACDEKKLSRLVMGGPMMGFTLASADIPVIKTTNCILAPSAQELPAPPPAQACIRCGLCAEACPVSLLPQQMYWHARSANQQALEAHHLFDCIECGACSYVCPSSIPLVQYYRAAKADIRKTAADRQKAEQARERYEARLQRMENLEAEKTAKRQERQNQVVENPAAGTTIDPVQAALERAKARVASPVATTATIADPVQAALERAKAKAAANATTTASSSDPVQAAIERANAKRKAAAEKEAADTVTNTRQATEKPD